MSITGEKKVTQQRSELVFQILLQVYMQLYQFCQHSDIESNSKGQHIDLSLMDSQVSWLSYVAQSYLISKNSQRIGNDHPSIVPYQTVKAKDGLMVLAIANDRQFKSFCVFAGLDELYKNPKFQKNSSRVKNRAGFNKIISKKSKKKL